MSSRSSTTTPTALVTPTTTQPRRFMRRTEVEQRTGLKHTHIYSLMKAGKFPKSVRLGDRAVAWDSLEVEEWIAERLAERQ